VIAAARPISKPISSGHRERVKDLVAGDIWFSVPLSLHCRIVR